MRIFLWKLGSLEHNLFPTEKELKVLSDCLIDSFTTNPNGDNNIIWGPDLECQCIYNNGKDDGINQHQIMNVKREVIQVINPYNNILQIAVYNKNDGKYYVTTEEIKENIYDRKIH